mmetsp:Transcript_23549/g.51689  ORF Transcript_23549/g.51689 Transcript_23549/m.51689 type:complete len:297 (+) Transcript_23549:209-1099(+)
MATGHKSLLFCLALVMTVCDVTASVYPGHLWDVYYNWTVPASVPDDAVYSMEVDFKVTKLDVRSSSNFEWSHTWLHTQKVPAAVAIQSGLTLPAENAVQTALHTNGGVRGFMFAVNNAIAGVPDTSAAGKKINPATNRPLSFCDPLPGGSGVMCHYSYNWTVGIKYILGVYRIHSNSTHGDAYRAIATEQTSKRRWKLGDITVPAQYGKPSISFYSYKYTANIDSCDALPLSAVEYKNAGLTMGGITGLPQFVTATLSSVPACYGQAYLDFCHTTAHGATPLAPPLTQIPCNCCRQ